MSRHLLFVALLMPLLFSCAAPQTRSDATADDAQLKREFLNDFARVKLKKNGSALLCDQAGYVQCYEITQAQCMRELESAKENCFKRAERRFPNNFSDAKDIDTFSKYYVTCISLHHVAMHSNKDTKKLGACLKSVQWDKKQRDRSLMK